MNGIVIIGAGECGVRAAFELRALNYDGPVTLLSAEAELPYERPPLSKEHKAERKHIRDEAAYAETNIDLQRGAYVEQVDTEAKTVMLKDRAKLPYDKLLFATGARARLFSGMEGCLTLRTASDALRIMENIGDGADIGIVGGGFIGLELAATARGAGANVTVFEASSRLLARAVPEEIASVVDRRHRSEGVDIRTGVVVDRADGRSVTLGNGETLRYDMVIAGVGAEPETVLAEASGLHVDNGIVVDHLFRTPIEDVFAAGDCCNFPWRGGRIRLESWRSAQDQGAHAAAAILGGDATFGRVPWFWSDQYDMTLQVAGLFDMRRQVSRRETGNETRIVFQCDPDGGLRAAAGIGPGNSVAKDIRLFEKLIEREAMPGVQLLADPSTNLKNLLKSA